MNTPDFSTDVDFSSNAGSKFTTLEDLLEVSDSPVVEEQQPIVETTTEEKKEVAPAEPTDVKTEQPATEKTVVEPTPEVVKEAPPVTNQYKDIIRGLVESGEWEEIEAFETEDGTVPFEDMDIDRDTFLTIYKAKQEDRAKQLTENKIDTSGLSPISKRLIEIEKNGGDIVEAFKVHQETLAPIEGFDLDTESGQQAVVFQAYKAQGYKDNDIVRLLRTFSKEELDEQAQAAYNGLKQRQEAELARIEKESIERKAAEKKLLKEYRTNLGNNLKTTFSLDESYRKKLVDLATKPIQDERYVYEIDRMYNEARMDPERAARLAMFLADEEEYRAQVSERRIRSEKVKTMNLIHRAKKKDGSNIQLTDKAESTRSGETDLQQLTS